MRRLIFPTAAALALVANAGVASAQGHERGSGPGGPSGGQPGGMHAPGPSGPNPGMHSSPGGASPRGELNAPRGYQPEGRNRAEGPQRTEPNRRAEPQRQPNQEREQRRATEQDRARTDRPREPDRNAERERAAQQRKAVEERQRAGERKDGNERRERLGDRREDVREARIRLGVQERERLHRSFDLQRARVANVRFDYHVGHRVPRDVRLFPVSREVLAFFPYYRDYSYFVVGDEICIVDPRTYEVVDVIEQGYWHGRPQVAGLRLSQAQIALVRDSIPRDFPEAPIRLRLALGAEIPGDVEVYELPPIVLDRVPELREFRFLVAGDQIVIVDPHDRSIAMVIDRA